MAQFYTNSLNKRNLEMNPEIMRALLNLSEIEKDPSLLLTRTLDVFNTPLRTDDKVLIALRTAPAHESFSSLAVKNCA